VISDPERADTELLGNVVQITKYINNRNQQNEVREGDLAVTVQVVWRDLRDGRVLSNPRRGPAFTAPVVVPSDIPQFDPDLPGPPPVNEIQVAQPVTLVAMGRYIPELGESNATAELKVVNKIAVQIVSMMEKPWGSGVATCPPPSAMVPAEPPPPASVPADPPPAAP
jgi:hypothetical protein